MTSLNTIDEPPLTRAGADLHDRLVRTRNGDPCYEPLAYSPSATRRAEVLEAHDEANTPYQRMRRRAERAEARCVDLEAEITRLRELLKKPRTASCGGSLERCVNAPTEPHSCPFSEEINDDSTTLCTCCADCMQECADDI